MPTPDERRAAWVEPGLAKRVVDGEVKSVSIDLRRVHSYQGNGMTLLPSPDGDRLILDDRAIRRLARLVGIVEPSPPLRQQCDACNGTTTGQFCSAHAWHRSS